MDSDYDDEPPMLEGPDIGVHRMQTDLAELEQQVEDMEDVVLSNKESCMHTSKSVEDLASQFAQLETHHATVEKERLDSMHDMIVANESSTQCLVKLVNALQTQVLHMRNKLEKLEQVVGAAGLSPVCTNTPPLEPFDRKIQPRIPSSKVQ